MSSIGEIQNSFPPVIPGSLNLSSLAVRTLKSDNEVQDTLIQNHFIVGNSSNTTADAGTDIQWDGTSLKLTDSKNFTVGTGDDLIITHNGTNSSITNTTGNMTLINSGTGTITITNTVGENINLGTTTTTGGINIGTALTSGTFTLGTSSTSSAVLYPRTDYTGAGNTNIVNKGYVDTTLAIAGTTWDIQFNASGELAAATGIFTFDSGTNVMEVLTDGNFVIGASSDLTISHNGTNSVITNITGDLTLTNTGSGDINLLTASGNATGAEIDLTAGNGTTTGGAIDINAGTGTTTGVGGSVTINAGVGGATSGDGGDIILTTGTATGNTNDNGVLQINSNLEQGISGEPRIVGSLTDATNFSTLFWIKALPGDYVCVTARASDTFSIVDVSDPTNPAIIGTLVDSTNLNDCRYFDISGKYAYISSLLDDYITIVDISDPSNPTFVSKTVDNVNLDGVAGILVDGEYLYAASGNTSDSISIWNILDPLNPFLVGIVTDGTILNAAVRIYIQGCHLYAISEQSDSLAVIDVSDKTNPTILGSLIDSTNLNAVRNIQVRGKYAFVVSSQKFVSVDVSDPANPTLEDSIAVSNAWVSYISGNYAYVGCVSSTPVSLINISDPTTLALETTLLGSEAAVGITGSGNYVYTINNSNSTFSVISLQGTTLASCRAGNIKTDILDVDGDSVFDQQVNVGSGLQVENSLLVDGTISANGVIQLLSSTVAGVPSASENVGTLIYVSNETGGATLAFSDGTNWRRVQDRNVVS